jgi:thymidylate kinase
MMLITLSGLDGAGKSTLAEALKSSLDRDGIPAAIFHMNKDVGIYAYLRNIRDAIKGRPNRADPDLPSEPRSETSPGQEPGRAKAALLEVRRRVIWNKSLRRWVDLGDLALFHIYRLYVERLRGRILIMDRYFYDRLADQADGRRWNYLRWFARITPVPDVPLLVEVSPEEAFERKGEYSIESMTARSANYREIFSWVPGSVTLSNDKLEVAVETLQRIVADRIRGSRSQPLAAEN